MKFFKSEKDHFCQKKISENLILTLFRDWFFIIYFYWTSVTWLVSPVRPKKFVQWGTYNSSNQYFWENFAYIFLPNFDEIWLNLDKFGEIWLNSSSQEFSDLMS